MQSTDYIVIAVIVGILTACLLVDVWVRKKWGG
jgi:hypothetical protein